jgi:hypothetical protein
LGASEIEQVGEVEAKPTVSTANCDFEPAYLMQTILKVVLAIEISAAIAYLGSKMV